MKKLTTIIIFLQITYILHHNLFSKQIKQKESNIIIIADKKKYYHQFKYWSLLGNPKIKNGQDTLSATSIKYYTDKKKGISIGNVKLFDHANTIEVFGNYGEYHTESKYAKLITNTKLFAIKDQIVIYSEIMERFAKKYIYVARNKVIVQLEREGVVATAGKGIYEIRNKRVVLIDHPQITHNNTKYFADEIIIYTDTKEVILNNNAKILNQNQKITAKNIHYYSNHPEKKAILTGNPSMVEYSDNDSILEGRPFRFINAEKIIYYNVDKGKATLIGNPVAIELFVEQKKYNKSQRYRIYKRIAKSRIMKYYGGTVSKHVLIGNARINEPYRAAFANKITFYDSANSYAILTGNPVLYEFYKRNQIDYSINNIKRKALAKKITYYFNDKKIILKEDAYVFEENKRIKGNFITYSEKNNKLGTVDGNAYIKQGNDYARANKILFSGENGEKLILKGDASFKKKDTEGEADYIEHDDKIGKTVLKGDARVIDKDKEAYGDDIVYTKKNNIEHAIIKGSPGIRKKDMEANANIIEYKKNKNKEVLYLDGNASMKDKKKHTTSDRIIYYTYNNKNGSKKNEKVVLKDRVKIIDSKRITKGDYGIFKRYYKNNKQVEEGYLKGNCEINKKDDSENAYGNELLYYKNEKGKEEYTLKGDAQVHDERKSGYADIIVILPDYNKKGSDKITLTGNPRIEDEDNYLIGEKIIIFNGKSGIIKAYKNAEYFSEKDGIKVNAGYIFYDEKQEKLIAKKDPVFYNQEDKLTVYSEQFESYRKKKKTYASGDVKINQGDKKIYGERAVYIEKNKTLTVTGKASVVQKDNVTRARKIILNSKNNKVKVIDVEKGQMKISE